MFICADHGNAEQLIDYETGEPLTAHTTNPVPFILVNADPKYTLRERRMPGRYRSHTDRADGNGTAGRHDRRKPSDREINNKFSKNAPAYQMVCRSIFLHKKQGGRRKNSQNLDVFKKNVAFSEYFLYTKNM